MVLRPHVHAITSVQGKTFTLVVEAADQIIYLTNGSSVCKLQKLDD